MSPTPEQLAREEIDRLLTLAGWVLQDKDQFDRKASEGVAVREFSLPRGECDYLLFVAGKVAGVIEAKKAGSTLSGVETQSERYIAKLPEHLARSGDRLVFHYESTGAETYFCDRLRLSHQPSLHAAEEHAEGLGPGRVSRLLLRG